MPRTSNDTARADAEAFIRELAEPIANDIGDDLIGIYLLGSLAHGGFSRRYSDLDIGITTEYGLTEETQAAIKEMGKLKSKTWANKISIFWTDRAFSVGRFPPLDRIDYLDHAIAVHEREHIVPPRPTRDDVRTYLAGRPLENWAASITRIEALTALDATDNKPLVRAFLYPARFAYSFETGKMASNDDAVAYLHTENNCGLDLDLIDRALACRQRANDPNHLLTNRHKLADQITACRRLIATVA